MILALFWDRSSLGFFVAGSSMLALDWEEMRNCRALAGNGSVNELVRYQLGHYIYSDQLLVKEQ